MTPYYQRDGITIYRANCASVLSGMKAAAVVTDPPDGPLGGERDNRPTNRILSLCLKATQGPVVWIGSPIVRSILVTDRYRPHPDRCAVWRATSAPLAASSHGMIYRWHPIWVWRDLKIGEDVIEASIDGELKYHEGAKPAALMAKLLEGCPSGLILDPYMGSGSTLIAAKAAGREAIGIDTDKRCCDIAIERLNA